MPPTQMSAKDATTMGRIYQHPASHNLEWRDVVALVEHLGTVDEKDNGHITFAVNGASQGFHRPRDKDISDVQQILDLREFLERSGYGKNGTVDAGPGSQLLVVINQKETLIFRTDGDDSIPQRIEPYDPEDNLRFLKHTEGPDIDARSPENLTYYKAIADTLAGAHEVLLMGNGTGGSSAMGHLQDFLTATHPEIAAAISGALTVDIEALTDGELLEKARDFYTGRAKTIAAAAGAG